MEREGNTVTAVRLTGVFLFAVVCAVFVYFMYVTNVIPHRSYSNEHFGIKPYISENDRDQDGVDDQTDILDSARAYIATEPKYKSSYYETGYPDDGYGVCTDVVANAFLGAGYDLRELVDQDISARPEAYDIDVPDKNIDFRRVRNLRIFFEKYASELTTDLQQTDQWQGGDVVIFQGHIGIVSDRRDRKGIPFVIHHSGGLQLRYEEDILPYRDDIVAHYRWQ